MSARPIATLLGAYPGASKDDLQAMLQTDWDLKIWAPANTDEDLTSALDGASAVVVGADALLSGRCLSPILQASQLKLFQIPFSGHEWLRKEMLPPGCTACNAYTHGASIAEYVMAAILNWEVNLAAISADFKTGSWRYAGSAGVGERHGEVAGKTLGIIGYGQIGQQLAKRADAFDMKVMALARIKREAPAPLSWLGTLAELETLLKQSDYVALACPLTEETAGLINTATLGQMKPSSVLINVARGPIIQPEDLHTALSSNQIRGAVLDTWYAYPTPDDMQPKPAPVDFAALDNVVMTPHCAAWTQPHHQRRWRAVAGNLDRLANGEALADMIDLSGPT